MNNRFISHKEKIEIEKFYKERNKKLYGECNGYDNETDAYLVKCEFNAILLQWYEIMLLRTLPVQNITILENEPKEYYNINLNTPIVTTGVCIREKYIKDFIFNGSLNQIGIDNMGNYFEILQVEKEFTFYEGDCRQYYEFRTLKRYLSDNNPELLNKNLNSDNYTKEERDNVIYETWEYLKSKMTLYSCNSCVDEYTVYFIPDYNPDYHWRVYKKDYYHFNPKCDAYKKIVALMDHKKLFKEARRKLYGQVLRPITKK